MQAYAHFWQAPTTTPRVLMAAVESAHEAAERRLIPVGPCSTVRRMIA